MKIDPAAVGQCLKSFDVDKVTKRFYERFKAEHSAFRLAMVKVDAASRRVATSRDGSSTFFTFFHDDDQNKDEHGEVDQLIQETKTGLTTAIAPLAGDLEAFLGIPKPKSDHRKPQHLLFLHETGQITADKVSAFCALVGACLPQKAGPTIGKET